MLLLQELLKDWPCTFTGEKYSIPIVGITENSKAVKPGYLFIARKGENDDGISYIDEAIRLGAAALVLDRILSVDIPSNIPIVVVPDCRKFISHASARLAGNPSERLKIIAITGTNGKTTVSHFISQLLSAFGIKTAVIGTLGIFIDGIKVSHKIPSMTTLPAEYLHPLLREIEEKGVTHVVMEASSLGLSTYRLEDCDIDVGVLLNIGVDHYEEHGSKESYIRAKQKLAKMAKYLVVNRDDKICLEMTEGVTKPLTFFGTSANANMRLQEEDGHCKLKTINFEKQFTIPFKEPFNKMNALAAICSMNMLSFRLDEILTYTADLTLPEGRMQRIEESGITVIVDYAHTPDALETVLQSLAQIVQGKIITVFGCGGNRDKGKRKEMGEIAAYYSSYVFVTTDNPRNEDPLRIIEDITDGFPKGGTAVQVEPDRAKAIQKAITLATADDIVLIAGKGHEKTQHLAKKVMTFSDVDVAKQALHSKIRKA